MAKVLNIKVNDMRPYYNEVNIVDTATGFTVQVRGSENEDIQPLLKRALENGIEVPEISIPKSSEFEVKMWSFEPLSVANDTGWSRLHLIPQKKIQGHSAKYLRCLKLEKVSLSEASFVEVLREETFRNGSAEYVLIKADLVPEERLEPVVVRNDGVIIRGVFIPEDTSSWDNDWYKAIVLE